MVKFFPAGQAGGPDMLALSAAFRDMQFMRTGGVSAANLNEYLAVPSVIACGGSWLTPAAEIADGNFEAITFLATEARAIAQKLRGKMSDFITFGEIMLRLKSSGHERFQSPQLEATFGGGEANVAVSLSNYGCDAAFVSALQPMVLVMPRYKN